MGLKKLGHCFFVPMMNFSSYFILFFRYVIDDAGAELDFRRGMRRRGGSGIERILTVVSTKTAATFQTQKLEESLMVVVGRTRKSSQGGGVDVTFMDSW
jgi:hypothetical protein